MEAYLRSIYPNSGLNGPRSGFRTPEQNAAVEGAADSRHMMPGGHAVDVHGIPTYRGFKSSLNALGLPDTWTKNETVDDPGTGPHFHGQWGEFQPLTEQRWFPTPSQYSAFNGNQPSNFTSIAKNNPTVTVPYDGMAANTPPVSPTPASLTTLAPTGLFGGGMATQAGKIGAGQPAYGGLTPPAINGSYSGADPSLPSLNFPGSGTYGAQPAGQMTHSDPVPGDVAQAPHTTGGGWGTNDFLNTLINVGGIASPIPGLGILAGGIKAATNSDIYNTNHASTLGGLLNGPSFGERGYDWLRGLFGGYHGGASEGDPNIDQIMNSGVRTGVSSGAPGLFGGSSPMSAPYSPTPAQSATQAPSQVDFSQLGQLPSLNFSYPGQQTMPNWDFGNATQFGLGLGGVATLPGQANNGLI
jgi:hypothetical protein